MFPPSQEQPTDGDRVVISGMSGLYPKTPHVQGLSNILYNKINPISKEPDLWSFAHPELVDYKGKISGLDRFDAQFFKVHPRLAINMEPLARKVLEQTHQAIYDAGLSPNHLWGKNVGVYIGSTTAEAEKIMFYTRLKSGSIVAGSIAALELAYLAIKRGDCDAAIVGGAHVCLHPQTAIACGRVLNQSLDGKTKSFDQNADGCAISDAINILLLQKSKDACRIYAEIVHVKNEFHQLIQGKDGPRFGYYRDPDSTATFLKDFYHEANVPPHVVEYVEAFGSATPEADKAELLAIEKVFCENRGDPLLVGSVMSNIGHSGAASGISAITKVLLGYYTGQIASNLHCDSPRDDIKALNEGSMRIVTDHEHFSRTYTAVNSMSMTGINAHVLLRGHYKPKDSNRYKTNIPRLVNISGRNDSAVKKIFDDLKSRPMDAEEIALLHNIHECKISGHLERGFTILGTTEESPEKTVSFCEKMVYFDDTKRPLWFVYSGMGSQWAGMGAQLMKIPVFAGVIERCHRVMEPKGLDIVDIISSPDPKTFDNILNSFVGIAAIQAGLTEVLQALGLVPDKIIGHSAGEVGCAYADGCFTVEEMILVAYIRGWVSMQTPFIRGSMAAVGIGYQKICKICPPEIEVACHNGPESCTISGPAEKMREFVAELTAKNIFAREVACSNIAYHTRYIADAGPVLRKLLKDVITTPKLRSERWLSTSVPQDKWDLPDAKYCSAEYQVQNMLSPVLFEEALQLVPGDAVLVEIAPHGLLQAILKRSLPTSCRNISLTRRAHSDSVLLFLQAIGDLYLEGYNPRVQALYPKVEFPVSTETPMLSHLVEWMHQEEMSLSSFERAIKKTAAASTCIISIHNKEHSYLSGHVIEGRILYPFAAALVAAWDTLAMSLGFKTKELPVHFTDVHLYAQPVLHYQRQLRLSVALHRGTGRFEITDNYTKIATGFVIGTIPDVGNAYKRQFEPSTEETLDPNVIYHTLLERGYSFRNEFCSVKKVNKSLTEADIAWSNNWVTFIDGILQFNLLRNLNETVSQISYIRRLCIDVKEHTRHTLFNTDDKTTVKAYACDEQDYTRCGGILLNNIQFRDLPVTVEKFGLKPLKYSLSSHQSRLTGRVVLQSSKIGDLDSLHWVDRPESGGLGVSVTVQYAGISNLDAQRATGILSLDFRKEICYGMDFSGVTENGDRVMGLVPCGAASSSVRARSDLLWPVPAHWSLQEAATVPLAYAHAFYCLVCKCQARSDMSILVHGGAGALGQAVISIALGLGYQVFTTVGDSSKKRFLCRLFPELKEEHIGNSRDGTYVDMVLNATKGKGCNLVICCLKGNFKNLSLKCCGKRGITLDIARVPEEDKQFGMSYLSLDRNYVRTDFGSIFENENGDISKIQRLISEGIARGFVRPLSSVTYELQEAPRAFRFLASGRHLGRVLLRLGKPLLFAQPRLKCTPEGSHVVICKDDGFLGLQLTDWLIKRGAKSVNMHCEIPPAHTSLKIRSWQKHGVNVSVSPSKVSSSNDVVELLKSSARMGPIEGLYMAAMTTDANRIRELAHVLGELDNASRKLCSSLRNFVVLCTDESFGQQTCLARAQDGLPTTLITLPVQEVVRPDYPQIDLPWYRGAVDVTERALCNSWSVSVAYRHPRPSLLEQLASVAGITVPVDAPVTTTLEDMGLERAKADTVAVYLRDVHNVYWSQEQVMTLSIEGMFDLETGLSDCIPKKLTGLDALISYVDDEAAIMSTNVIFLPTLTQSDEMSQEFDVTKSHMILIPGIEGHHERFRALCECLKLPALVMQTGIDHPHETIQDTAQRLAEVLLKHGGLKDNFYLLGYESGVMVALEIASILEDHGATGTVFCLGGGPDEIVGEVLAQISAYSSEEELQDAVLRHMYALLTGGSTTGLDFALRGSNWSMKLEAYVRLLLNHVPLSAQYTRTLIEAVYGKIIAVRSYKGQPRPLRSRVVVLRASFDSASAPNVASLQQYSQLPVTVYQLAASLAQAPADLQCAAIIDKHLGADVLDAYDCRNICDTYSMTT